MSYVCGSNLFAGDEDVDQGRPRTRSLGLPNFSRANAQRVVAARNKVAGVTRKQAQHRRSRSVGSTGSDGGDEASEGIAGRAPSPIQQGLKADLLGGLAATAALAAGSQGATAVDAAVAASRIDAQVRPKRATGVRNGGALQQRTSTEIDLGDDDGCQEALDVQKEKDDTPLPDEQLLVSSGLFEGLDGSAAVNGATSAARVDDDKAGQQRGDLQGGGVPEEVRQGGSPDLFKSTKDTLPPAPAPSRSTSSSSVSPLPNKSKKVRETDLEQQDDDKECDNKDDVNVNKKRAELFAALKRVGIQATSAAVGYVGLTATLNTLNPGVALSTLLGAKLFTRKGWIPAGETTQAVLDGLILGGVAVAATNIDKMHMPSLPTVFAQQAVPGIGLVRSRFGQLVQSSMSSQSPTTNYLSQPYETGSKWW